MVFRETNISGLYLIDLTPFEDLRGFFSRIFCKREFSAAGLVTDFVQSNHSITNQSGSIRGLHYQRPPHMEVKLIMCVTGAVWDVVVDLRENSPTYLQHFGVQLSEFNRQMIYIPQGFAHGFQTMKDHSSLIYQHSDYYHPESENGLKYNDPALSIQWPMEVTNISIKDQNHPWIDDKFEGIRIL
ncbi:MAG: dTDP-4-dehydrorhamnose 3,5-epimerase [Saprospiraceae bacterium]|nr:dTDP-4-dehydrorhamnose 3,5-epimerase [Saprospiraceae bacterium]